ncbi:TraR/DksA family transcriptional regulator [Kribbella capetownensis]|uniref:TraR/DksA family transcriptional regulator n=1 Tax=Kribbella capetownensis TaxID=1572659 RepID=UPI00192E2894|nr:hypothetical protein [Kribbella capetownensis]
MTSHTSTAANVCLSRRELAMLRAGLLEQRSFRREQLLAIRESSQPQPESGRYSAARAEVHSHLAVAARIVLADVEAALDRMDTGHYGQCRSCWGAVELARLRICPQTRYCAACHHRLQDS